MFDKRVVEFALAIPEELQIVNGRARYLALAALGDVLPPELASASRAIEVLDPDFESAAKAALPVMREEIERMRGRDALATYVDLDRLAAEAAPERTAKMSNVDLSRLMRAFVTARYIAWFNRLNL